MIYGMTGFMKRKIEPGLTLQTLAESELGIYCEPKAADAHFPLLETLRLFAETEPVISSDAFVYEIAFSRADKEILIYLSKHNGWKLIFQRTFKRGGTIGLNHSITNPSLEEVQKILNWFDEGQWERNFDRFMVNFYGIAGELFLITGYLMLAVALGRLFQGQWKQALTLGSLGAAIYLIVNFTNFFGKKKEKNNVKN